MKTDVADVYPGCERHAKGLNAAVEVLVVQGILIVPDPSSGIRHFVGHEPDAVIPRIGFELIHCGTCPGHDGGLHSHGRAGSGKCVTVATAADGKPAIGGIVIHVALTWMRLAP